MDDREPQPEAHGPPQVGEEGGQVEGQEVRGGHPHCAGEGQVYLGSVVRAEGLLHQPDVRVDGGAGEGAGGGLGTRPQVPIMVGRVSYKTAVGD